MQGRVEEICLQ